MTYLHNLLSTTPAALSPTHTITYMILYVALASCVYLVLVKRASEELGRKTIDAIFFAMLGAGSLIWFLSKVPPIS
ncbi:MAG: hypothetical protein AAFR61_02515 [Bacteroidota bacterium]